MNYDKLREALEQPVDVDEERGLATVDADALWLIYEAAQDVDVARKAHRDGNRNVRTEQQWPDGIDLIYWALVAIALILAWGFWGDDVLRWFECRSMKPGEYLRALISGYCS